MTQHSATATSHCFALFTNNFMTANRTIFWHTERRIFRYSFRRSKQIRRRFFHHRTLCQHHRNNFRNNISGTAHNNRVTLTYILALCFTFIMQSCIGNCNTTYKYRRQPCYWCYCTGTSYLYINSLYRSQHFLCRKFLGNSKTRSTGYIAKLLLLSQIIHLNHYTIDAKRQIRTYLKNMLIKSQHFPNISLIAQIILWRYCQPQTCQQCQLFAVAIYRKTLIQSGNSVGIEMQAPACRYFRIQLA